MWFSEDKDICESLQLHFEDADKNFYTFSRTYKVPQEIKDVKLNVFAELLKLVEYDFGVLYKNSGELKQQYKLAYEAVQEINARHYYNEFIKRCYKICEGFYADSMTLLGLAFQMTIDNKKLLSENVKDDLGKEMDDVYFELQSLVDLKQYLTICFEEIAQIYNSNENGIPVHKRLRVFKINQKVICSNGELKCTYFTKSPSNLYHLLASKLFASEPKIRLCNNCNRFFEPKTKKVTLYCDRVTNSGNTCKVEGARKKHKSIILNDEVLKMYMAERHRIYMYCDRVSSNSSFAFEDYYKWFDEMEPVINDYKEGKIQAEEVLNLIEQKSKEFVPPKRDRDEYVW